MAIGCDTIVVKSLIFQQVCLRNTVHETYVLLAQFGRWLAVSISQTIDELNGEFFAPSDK